MMAYCASKALTSLIQCKIIAMLTPLIFAKVVLPAPFGSAMMTMRLLLVDDVIVTQKT